MSDVSKYFDLIRLSAVPGVGPNRMRTMIGHFRSVSKVFKASLQELQKIPGIDEKTAKSVVEAKTESFAEKQIKKAEELKVRIISFWDEEFPELLKQIYDPPVLLYVKGNFSENDKYALSIIGTRNPTHYGKIITEKLTTSLAEKGITIISGMAYGIDSIAHSHALKAGSRTLAVVGTGLDITYPSGNQKLSLEIAENGALISEFPFGTKPDRQNFPRRNRIVSGLSHGVIVVEAGIKSGALITASMAIEQNREVFAVPGNINSPQSVGPNALIKQGACLVISAEDILGELSPKLDPIIKGDSKPKLLVELSSDEAAVLSKLSHEPKHVDELVQSVDMRCSQVLSVLLTLEFKNQIRQLSGKMFVKI